MFTDLSDKIISTYNTNGDKFYLIVQNDTQKYLFVF